MSLWSHNRGRECGADFIPIGTNELYSITNEPIDSNALLQSVSDPHCGATVLFLGSTRQWTKGRETKWLEYDAYREMALTEMKRLEEEAMAQWSIRHVALIHRLGKVEIGETSVAVAVGSPHRTAAFAAGKWLIDELKKQVPIWKKEIFAESEPEWVHPGLPDTTLPITTLPIADETKPSEDDLNR